jgi:hypothetical protein
MLTSTLNVLYYEKQFNGRYRLGAAGDAALTAIAGRPPSGRSINFLIADSKVVPLNFFGRPQRPTACGDGC